MITDSRETLSNDLFIEQRGSEFFVCQTYWNFVKKKRVTRTIGPAYAIKQQAQDYIDNYVEG